MENLQTNNKQVKSGMNFDKIDQLNVLRNYSKEEYEKYLNECKISIKDMILTEIKARSEIEEENTKNNQDKIKKILVG